MPSFSRRDIFSLAGKGAALGALMVQVSTSALAVSSDVKSLYKINKLIHGVAYYPELWPDADVDADIAEMQSLGINLVRMAEFAWSTMETTPGDYDFRLFKTVMDKMHAAGIDVVLCTPTATPPAWLTHNHPERCHKNADGTVMSHGARQHASYEHPAVREACFNIIRRMSHELGRHPALIGWQLDNEMKAHVAEDFSDAAIANWRKWLQQRFGTIEALNEAWGTHIWSQHYNNFDQVPAPVTTPFLHNASLITAYKLFCRESVADFMLAQRNVIREFSDLPITHNDNPAFNIHHERSMQALDFAAYDAYPTAEQWSTLVFRSDLYRAAIPGRPFWLMETSVAHNGWLGNHQPIHPAGFLAAEASLIYALGGEGFCYWLWRQQRSGAELPHSAVKSAWNAPSIGYHEVKKVSEAKQQLEPTLLSSTLITPEVAVTYSDHARAMFETEPLDKRAGFPNRYRGIVEMWHKQLLDAGLHREARFEGASLDGLKLLITPAMPYVSEAFLIRAEAFMRRGGIWIAGPVTGTRGKEHTVPVEAGLGLLEKMAGVSTQYLLPLTGTKAQGELLGVESELSGWCAAVKAKAGTSIVGTITKGRAKGLAFATERPIGKGKLVMLGAQPHGDNSDAMLNRLIGHYAQQAGVKMHFDVPEGIVIVPRKSSQGKLLWIVLNMLNESKTVSLPAGATDMLSGRTLGPSTLLSPYARLIINTNQEA